MAIMASFGTKNNYMENDKIIRDAQYRKGLSIAFFNATNSAIALIAPVIDQGTDLNAVLDKVYEIRDKMLKEHQTYYATVIAQVGANYNAQETIERLKACKNYDELNKQWILLSEDERRDGEIRKVVKELKDSFKV